MAWVGTSYHRPIDTQIPTTVGVAIVGAGFAGIAAAAALKQDHLDDFVILERADDVGGVWRDNNYPGCRCDIPAVLYSFSFTPGYEWPDRFASQRNIRGYLRHCVDELAIRDRLHTKCDVRALRWSPQDERWDIETSRGRLSARMIVVATGTLNEPSLPAIDGRDTFAGTSFHSSQWPEHLDLSGKHVAVIGTGASAVQLVPAIAPNTKSVTVFQRTPAWVVPRGDKVVPAWRNRLYRTIPLIERAARWGQYQSRELMSGAFGKPGLRLRFIERAARRHLTNQVRDADLRAKLTPAFRIGCKRILRSDDWYPAIASGQVRLVDDAVTAVSETGVTSANGEHHATDVIVYATGFRVNRLPIPFVIHGSSGRTLAQEWGKSRPSAYLGTTVAGFPNMAIMTGPNTGLPNSSMLLIMESQARYAAQMAGLLQQDRHAVLDVRPDVQLRYTHEIDRRLTSSVWVSGGCTSWYQDHKGRVVTLWPGSTAHFARLTRTLNPADYVTANSRRAPGPER